MAIATINYNAGQLAAIDGIVKSLSYGNDGKACLQGAAGTGKTTTFKEILRRLQKERYGDERGVCIAAPTNKAVRVAKSMFASEGLSGVDFKTVHSLLGLMVEDSEGRKDLRKREIDQLRDIYHTIIFDEASQIGSELKTEIINECWGCNILGVGDQNQLPPIQKKKKQSKQEGCVASNEEPETKQSKFPFFDYFDASETFRLSEVMRQKDSPTGGIVDVAARAVESNRKNFDPRNYKEYFQQSADSEKGVWCFSVDNFYPVLAQAFGAAKEKGNYWDETRLICFHHKSIVQINQYVRCVLYGDTAKQTFFLPGEPLTCLSPVVREHWCEESEKMVREIIFPTSTELRVINAYPDIQKVELTKDYFLEYKCWRVLAQEPESQINKELCIICPSDADRYEEQLNYFKQSAINKRITWFSYYKLMSYFDDVRVGYGLTAYSSQGSTYKNVFVVCPDILNVRDQDVQRRSFYVALSRVTDKLIMC